VSIYVQREVIDYSNADGPRLLALLAIADSCNREGEGWISFERIARWMRRSERAAYKAVSELVSMEEVEVIGKHGHTNVYRVNVGAYARDAGATPDETGRVGKGANPDETGRVQVPDNTAENGTLTKSAPMTKTTGATLTKTTGAHLIGNPPNNHPTGLGQSGQGKAGKEADGIIPWEQVRPVFAAVCDAVGWRVDDDFRLSRRVSDEVRHWMGEGWDLQRHILPTLRELVARYQGDGLPAPKYFREAIARCAAADPGVQATAGMTAEERKRAVRVRDYARSGVWLSEWGGMPCPAEVQKVREVLPC